jgi:hypothetical protein
VRALLIKEPRSGRVQIPRSARERGDVVDLGPDRQARLAVASLLQLLTAGHATSQASPRPSHPFDASRAVCPPGRMPSGARSRAQERPDPAFCASTWRSRRSVITGRTTTRGSRRSPAFCRFSACARPRRPRRGRRAHSRTSSRIPAPRFERSSLRSRGRDWRRDRVLRVCTVSSPLSGRNTMRARHRCGVLGLIVDSSGRADPAQRRKQMIASYFKWRQSFTPLLSNPCRSTRRVLNS